MYVSVLMKLYCNLQYSFIRTATYTYSFLGRLKSGSYFASPARSL